MFWTTLHNAANVLQSIEMATQILIYGNALKNYIIMMIFQANVLQNIPSWHLATATACPKFFFFWLPTGQSSLQMLQNWFRDYLYNSQV